MSGKVGPLVLIAIAVALQVSRPTPAVAASAQIKDISPAVARRGERVTIKGNGFGAGNVRVAVGGVPAQVVAATGNQATLLVPTSAAPGPTQVTATNPGGHTGSIGFRVLEGILLTGNTTTPAVDAIFDLPPVGVDTTHIESGIIMSRLDVQLAPDATVGEVNAALGTIAGGIVSMMRGTLMITVAVPRQPTLGALAALVGTLNGAPGIRRGHLARTPSPEVLPPVPLGSLAHLLDTRFPAAWNAKKLLDGCSPVTVLIADLYGDAPAGFATELPTFGAVVGGTDATLDLPQHGYEVTGVLGGLFNSSPPTGAHPFSQITDTNSSQVRRCLDLRPIQVGNLSLAQVAFAVAQAMPAGKFVTNFSIGFRDKCTGPCLPANVLSELLPASERADHAVTWKSLTHTRWNDVVIAAAAGNKRTEESASIYAGIGRADFGSPFAISRLADPLFGWVQEAALWAPSPAHPTFPTLAASSADAAILQHDVALLGLDTIPPADNVLVVGSLTTALTDSAFSRVGADVMAVGEGICVDAPCAVRVDGTSLATPQVAGLAAYLWNLSADLRNRPAGDTVRAIRRNAVGGILDAYAAVLSLDAAALPDPTTAPIRKAILDLNDDGRFDERDLEEFIARYFPNGELLEPMSRTHFRVDLNGDGFSGGSRTDRFDLDRLGSTQFGAALYSVVTQTIEGASVAFNEMALTDLQILCYYAYAPLYDGDTARRSELLAGKCTEETATGTIVRTESGGIQSGGGCDPHTGGVYSDVLTVTVTVSLDTAGAIVVTDASGEEHMSGQVFLVSPCGIGTVLIGSVSFAGSVIAASFSQSDTQTGVLFVTVTGQRMNQLGETFDDTASHALPARIVSSAGRPVLLDFSHSSGGDGRTLSISGSLRLSP